MKINWGTGIAIFYGTFVLVFIGIVLKSTQYDLNMVKKDYYTDDLNYQAHFTKMQNEKNLGNGGVKVTINDTHSAVKIQFPTGMPATGKVTLFHPAKAKDDKIFEIQTNETQEMVIPTEGLPNGLWRVQVDWASGNKAFYSEQHINIQNSTKL